MNALFALIIAVLQVNDALLQSIHIRYPVMVRAAFALPCAIRCFQYQCKQVDNALLVADRISCPLFNPMFLILMVTGWRCSARSWSYRLSSHGTSSVCSRRPWLRHLWRFAATLEARRKGFLVLVSFTIIDLLTNLNMEWSFVNNHNMPTSFWKPINSAFFKALTSLYMIVYFSCDSVEATE